MGLPLAESPEYSALSFEEYCPVPFQVAPQSCQSTIGDPPASVVKFTDGPGGQVPVLETCIMSGVDCAFAGKVGINKKVTNTRIPIR